MNNKQLTEALQEQVDFESSFMDWYDSGLKLILDDNRRRYEMELADKKERLDRGLSAVPSTKSTSTVDRAVEKALMEYHQDPDAMSFTQRGVHDPRVAGLAKILTEVFKYRAEYTFPFFEWHSGSLTAGYTDGMEAAIISWRKEAYTEKRKVYIYDDGEQVQEVEEEVYKIGRAQHPDLFRVEEVEEEEVVRDTFWIDSLKPGEDILWDFKIPILDLELCQRVLVKSNKSIEEIKSLYENGVIDIFDEDEIEKYKSNSPEYDSSPGDNVPDTDAADLGDLNRLRLWIYFEKVNYQWKVSFSIDGKHELTKEPKSVNDVFFNGRKVNRLPCMMGTIKSKLWKALGRGLPEGIAPIEDEWTDHRNNINDAVKTAIQGRWRIGHMAEVDLDQLLNSRAFRADKGDVEKLDTNANIIDSLRATDLLGQDLSEMVPVGMESKTIVPRGTAKTLGAVELGLDASNEKMSVHLLHRNKSFLSKVLYIIGEMILAYETDDTIIKVAGSNAGVAVPMANESQVNLSALDLKFQVKINPGLGSMPRQQKGQLMMQLADWRAQRGVPTDFGAIAQQLNILAGFKPSDFTPTEMPPPPGPEFKGNVNIDLELLPENLRIQLIEKMLGGSSDITVNAQDKVEKTGEQDGAPRASDMVRNDEEGLPPGGVQQGGEGGWS